MTNVITVVVRRLMAGLLVLFRVKIIEKKTRIRSSNPVQ